MGVDSPSKLTIVAPGIISNRDNSRGFLFLHDSLQPISREIPNLRVVNHRDFAQIVSLNSNLTLSAICLHTFDAHRVFHLPSPDWWSETCLCYPSVSCDRRGGIHIDHFRSANRKCWGANMAGYFYPASRRLRGLASLQLSSAGNSPL